MTASTGWSSPPACRPARPLYLRLYCKVLRQAGSTFSQSYMEETLARHAPDRAPPRAAVRASLRSRPRRPAAPARRDRRGTGDRPCARRGRKPRRRPHPARLPDAHPQSVRTNYYQTGPSGEPKPALAVKLASSAIDLFPLPRPLYEIYVYSPRVEGVHMRAGRVARGGIRWSDRKEDFRTEILGLMKAQTVKNAVIVPGRLEGRLRREAPARPGAAKLPRTARGRGDRMLQNPDPRPPRPDRQHRRRECGSEAAHDRPAAGRWCATTATTPISSSPPTRAPPPSPTPPTRSPRNTASGSATRSPRAGSAGYDHKEMGITSRGAWELIKRHFRELGRDIQTSDFHGGRGRRHGGRRVRQRPCCSRATPGSSPRSTTCTSSSIPTPTRPRALPNASGSSTCRARAGPITTRALISPGGGVFDRALKAIPISAADEAALRHRRGPR